MYLNEGMSSALTDRQRDELCVHNTLTILRHKSLLEYLYASGLQETFDALKREVKLDTYEPDSQSKYAGLLEKKWLSTIRLQKKVCTYHVYDAKNMDLSAKVAELEAELQSAPSARRSASVADWYPRVPPRHTLLGHRQPITSVAFHPTFSLVASASEDCTIKIWDWETGDLEQTLKGHTKPIQSLTFDHAGQYLVSCSSDLSTKIWDGNDGWKNIRTLHGHDHSVSCVLFMPGDQHIATASRDKSIKFWETSTGFCSRTLLGHDDWVRAIVASSDGRWLASGSSDQSVRVWDTTSGEVRHELRGHGHVVECVAFAPVAAYENIRTLGAVQGAKDDPSAMQPGQFLASGSRDKTHGHDNWVRSITFSPNGKFLLSVSDDKTMRVWDLATARCLKVVECHSHFVTCLAWGRSRVDVNAKAGSTTSEQDLQPVNVVATGSVDLSLKIWVP